MQKFYCFASVAGIPRIIGISEGIDGDTAWQLAQLTQPNVEYLVEIK